MAEYFYTLDLGPTYGPKLEALAALASYEDVEAFAAMILCHALDAMEGHEPNFGADDDMDDGIPF